METSARARMTWLKTEAEQGVNPALDGLTHDASPDICVLYVRIALPTLGAQGTGDAPALAVSASPAPVSEKSRAQTGVSAGVTIASASS